ncbi:MAG: hypothetical protein K6E38_08120 [Fretibacterium sp.]|nr:hypothetical protein [Fretibacterium sp.]
MNRYEIERNMKNARDAISKVFQKDGSGPVDKMMRSKISAFGAMVLMSGVVPALCYYRDNEEKIVDLVAAMYDNREPGIANNFVKVITDRMDQQGQRETLTENIINDSVSLKLAFNLFDLQDMKKK